MSNCMRRRQFIALLAGAAGAPLVVRSPSARAQQLARMRRVGVLMNLAADDPDGPPRITAFAQGLQEAGWAVGRNVRIDYRWGPVAAERPRLAAELLKLAPDVLLASGGAGLFPLQQTTRSVPIVFVAVLDPVGIGIVESLARPGGNITGFSAFEVSIGGKWIELLKQIAPQMTRAAVLRSPTTTGMGQFGALQAAAASVGVELSPVSLNSMSDVERGVTAFARSAGGGLIVTVNALAQINRARIIELAMRHRLPSIYPYRVFAADGGLISFGPDMINQFRQAAGYVDRILRGEKPADLPVQAPTKYETVLNLKTAKALGLQVPASVFARADEVIE